MESVEPVYLDNNATTPIDIQVIEEITQSLCENWGNASSNHSLGLKAKSVIEESRQRLALMINSKAEDIIFTSGGTEANNMALLSSVKMAEKFMDGRNCKPHVITSSVEHDSVMKVLQDLKNCGRINLSVAELNHGNLEVETVRSLICNETCLVSVMHANNETGIIMPIADIGSEIRLINDSRSKNGESPIWFHTDAAQTIGKVSVDVDNLKVDYLTIVGHKFYGPRVGALYARDVEKHTSVSPMILGGGQERGFRPGTENTAMIAGLGRASLLVVENLPLYETTMALARDYFQAQLCEKVPNVHINFVGENRLPNTLSIAVPPGYKASDVLQKCKNKFYASLGAACHSNEEKPSGILIASGLSPAEASRTIRFSVGRSNSFGDIDFVVNSISDIIQ